MIHNAFVYGQDDEGKGPLDRDMGQRMYQCSDNKWIVVACLQVRQGMRFVREVLEIPHQDGDFSSDTALSRWPQITPETKELNLKRFNHIIKTKPQSYWLDKCLTGNVPCAPVSTYEDLQKGMQTEVGKQARVNDWIVTSNHRDYGDVDLVSNPTRYNGTPNQPIGDGDEVVPQILHFQLSLHY
jgi:crotonobetainyl-CoA:carnitine CoA-transferase CaiB-like acyl-CoA transferase